MAGRGPIPKDPKKRIDKHGSRRPAPTEKAVPGPALPVPPDDLPTGLVPVWAAIMAELDSRGGMPAAFHATDVMLVRVLVDAVYVHDLARADVLAQGITVPGRWGPTTNPSLKTQKEAGATILRVATELGLSPAARTRLGLLELVGASMVADLKDRLIAKLASGK